MNEEATARIRISAQLIAGLLLAGLGVLFTLDNLHIVHAREVLRYWPAVLLLVGTSQVLQARSLAGMIGGSIWLLIGAVLLGERLHLISNVFRYWPLLLVVIGGYVAWQSFNRGEVKPAEGAERISAVSILGGVDRRVTSSKFQGADLTAFMGGGKIDLRDAIAPVGGEAIIDVTAVMGGYEIKIPESWNAVVEIVPFMGGYEDKTHHPSDLSAPRLRVRGFVMMGGIEIRN